MRTAICLQGVDTPDDFEANVTEIERLGYDTLWLTDSSLHTRNCWSYLTLAARATSRLRLGTAVTNPVTRHPGVTAAAAATIAEISGGRFTLGIGAGDRPLLAVGHKPARLADLEASISATINPRRPFSSTSFCCFNNCRAWLIGCRDTPSTRPSSSWRMRCPGASVPLAMASANRS